MLLDQILAKHCASGRTTMNSHGRSIADAAATVGECLTHLIWSELRSPKDIRRAFEGQYSGIHHFDSKAAITDYIGGSGRPSEQNERDLHKLLREQYASFGFGEVNQGEEMSVLLASAAT
jgi:NmrA-like family